MPPDSSTANMLALSYLSRQTHSVCDACIIWLHGLGADGHDFADIIPQLQLPSSVRWRFVFPHAPLQPVTINGGAVMRAWYDIFSLSDLTHEDGVGIRRSAAMLDQLIVQQLAEAIPSERIVLAGFSQGGAIALYAGLRSLRPLGGLIALSTYLPLLSQLNQEASSANRGIPIFQAHGDFDSVLPSALGQQTYQTLKAAGYSIEWRGYPMAHQVCLPELQAIGTWLSQVLT